MKNGEKVDNSEPVIEAIELRRNFNEIQAVAGISFSINHGEIFGLLGPNGAGKTTTTRLLTGQIDPSSLDYELGLNGDNPLFHVKQ